VEATLSRDKPTELLFVTYCVFGLALSRQVTANIPSKRNVPFATPEMASNRSRFSASHTRGVSEECDCSKVSKAPCA